MTFRFCPRCGAPLTPAQRGGRLRPACMACGFVHYRNPTVGVAVILLQNGRILLGRRSPDSSYAGRWCIPCGHVEYDEEIRQAATREFAEETGLIVQVGEVAAVHSNFHNPAQHTVGVWFFGHEPRGTLQAGDDLDRVDYFALDALPAALAFPTDLTVLANLRDR